MIVDIDPDNFDWDEEKNQLNIRKHGISFREAREVLFDSFVSYEFDHVDDNGETRFSATGRLLNQTLLVVIHVYRDHDDKEIIRIISARKADAADRRRYIAEIVRRRTEDGC